MLFFTSLSNNSNFFLCGKQCYIPVAFSHTKSSCLAWYACHYETNTHNLGNIRVTAADGWQPAGAAIERRAAAEQLQVLVAVRAAAEQLQVLVAFHHHRGRYSSSSKVLIIRTRSGGAGSGGSGGGCHSEGYDRTMPPSWQRDIVWLTILVWFSELWYV